MSNVTAGGGWAAIGYTIAKSFKAWGGAHCFLAPHGVAQCV